MFDLKTPDLARTLSVGLFWMLLTAPASRAQSTEVDRPPAVQNAPEDDEFLFLKLGVEQDYLEAERWRIIDQIEQAIPPLYEPILPFHGYTLPPGAWRVGMKTTIGHNPGDYGTDDFYELFFDDVEVDFLRANLGIQYGFEFDWIKDLVIALDIPYKFTKLEGEGHPWRIENFLMTMDGAGEGLGDISLTLKKKWLDQGNWPVTFSTILGVIFPTADDDQEFNSGQNLFVNGTQMPVAPPIDVFGTQAGEQLLPRVAQPGNGAWGGRIGFGVTRQFERSALHGGAVFDLLADTDDDITPGNELKYGLSYVFPPFESDKLSLDLSVFGRWKGDEQFPGQVTHPKRDPDTGGPMIDLTTMMPKLFTTDRPDFEHGNMTFVSPSLIFIPSPNTRFFVSPAFRVLEPDQGPSPEWLVSVGFTYTF